MKGMVRYVNFIITGLLKEFLLYFLCRKKFRNDHGAVNILTFNQCSKLSFLSRKI